MKKDLLSSDKYEYKGDILDGRKESKERGRALPTELRRVESGRGRKREGEK